MSIIQLNPDSFKRNVYGITRFYPKYAYGSTMLTYEISPYFETLQIMNAKSYAERYKDTIDYIPFKEVSITDEHKNMASLLKSLQCLEYNIELDKMNYDEKEAMNVLNYHIDYIKNYLINELTEYKDAQWG